MSGAHNLAATHPSPPGNSPLAVEASTLKSNSVSRLTIWDGTFKRRTTYRYAKVHYNFRKHNCDTVGIYGPAEGPSFCRTGSW
jgi:hypothetical protein